VDVRALLAADTGPQLGQSRAEVLGLLRAADRPTGVREIAAQTRLHPNTARFHLDGLVMAGLATRVPQPRAVPGRPRAAYRAVEGAAATGERRYRLLAEILTSLIMGVLAEPGDAAAQAGREWGRYLTEQPAPYQRPAAATAIAALTAMLERIGFAPEAMPARTGYQLRLHQCPFREVAEGHQEVICQLHLGLMQGALAQMRAPLTATGLQPFAEPGRCLATLEPGSPGQ
jgi:predicted ArsR family transcriptional regulator